MVSDCELKDLIRNMAANMQLVGLVKMMQPMDIIAVISKDLSLSDCDATSVVANLLQHLRHEGIAPLGKEPMQFPVPNRLKRRNSNVEEDFINNLGAMTPVMDPSQFPPEPQPDASGWPYDGMTKRAMDPKNKGRKRPLTSSVDPQKIDPTTRKNPFDLDITKNRPGGDSAGLGIYSKQSPHSRDNSSSTSASSWDTQGVAGFSRPTADRTFTPPPPDMQNMKKKEGNLPNDDIPDALKVSPVGSSIPTMNYGGYSAPRKMGFRRR